MNYNIDNRIVGKENSLQEAASMMKELLSNLEWTWINSNDGVKDCNGKTRTQRLEIIDRSRKIISYLEEGISE